ncbi:hypothetical protein QE152_g37940 [Popillia japonica]|uniref:Uncharacterized protein n=1 Tax=Popillia japonica TaxID=7064 RepID=A0AAW1I8J9_POPJA
MDADQDNEKDTRTENLKEKQQQKQRQAYKDRNAITTVGRLKTDNDIKSNKLGKAQNVKKTDIWKLGVWNVRSLKGKEDEIVYEFEKAGLDILIIPETKKKGEGEIQLLNEHVLIHSGVPKTERAADGIACVIHEKLAGSIISWKGWSEKILAVELTIDEEKITILAIYGPNEDESKEIKDKFWNDLTLITD